MDNDSLKTYFKDLRKIEVLSSDEQTKLAIAAKNGDKKAFKKLTECNLKFVVSIAREYEFSKIPLQDLINEGNIGLIKSINKFDSTKGIKFISYAVWWIRQSIIQSVYDNGTLVRIPINRINISSKVNKTRQKLTQEFNREPTLKELSKETNLREKDVKISFEQQKCFVELDSPASEDGDLSIGEVTEGDGLHNINKNLSLSDCRKTMNGVLSSLSEREEKIVRMYFGLGVEHEMTLSEIGVELQLTNERVRQIKEFALKKLRTYNKSRKLREFLNNI